NSAPRCESPPVCRLLVCVEEDRVKPTSMLLPIVRVLALCAFLCMPALLHGQGVTTAAMSGVVTDQNGAPLPDANVVAVHVPSGTQYRAVTRAGGTYNVPNMRVGGPYRVTATRIGYRSHTEADVFLSLGQDLRVDFRSEEHTSELQSRRDLVCRLL